jgi:hypothetical protein
MCTSIQALLDSKKLTKDIHNSILATSLISVDSFSDDDIIFFLHTMDCNRPFLQEVITSYRLDFPSTSPGIGDLIEIVRMLDILGAVGRYQEYGLLLHQKLNFEIKIEDWIMYADRIPVSFGILAKIPLSIHAL